MRKHIPVCKKPQIYLSKCVKIIKSLNKCPLISLVERCQSIYVPISFFYFIFFQANFKQAHVKL